MRSKSFEGMTCSVASVLDALGDRWGALVMRDLIIGLRRFDDLCRSTGVTTATLSDRLKRLERAGLVERRKYQMRPDRYEYVPTRMGLDIRLALQAMMQVGDAWNLAGLDGPPMRSVNARTGNDVKLGLFDVKTGERLAPEDVLIQTGPGADDVTTWRLNWVRSSHPEESHGQVGDVASPKKRKGPAPVRD